MPQRIINVGSTPLVNGQKRVSGDLVELDGKMFYKIENVDHLGPFLISVVSASDHWMFISSNGALTAGRKNSDNALFPYYTDDKIHDSRDVTGSKTILVVTTENESFLWEPLSDRYSGVYSITRNLYKSASAECLRFEEINHDLGLSFWYEWSLSEQFGFVKRSRLVNNSDAAAHIHLLDGIQNVLPYGVDQLLQTERSTLIDAYKKAELHRKTGLCTLSLSSMLVDKPEPAEALRATTIWSSGLPDPRYLISSRQLKSFRRGYDIEQEVDVRAERGAYFITSAFDLSRESDITWHIVSEINQGPAEVANLVNALKGSEHIEREVDQDLDRSRDNLRKIVASADGFQLTRGTIFDKRHSTSVLFNVMRGGVFDSKYTVSTNDFLDHISSSSEPVYSKYATAISSLTNPTSLAELRAWSTSQNDSQLSRLTDEYLPLSFSRRHGDPSRPWNSFSIETKKADGSPNLSYEGNWRDIFQNWEALLLSYPAYIESTLAKFLNATTLDGYNPYRLTRQGIDWEIENLDDPWSHIGYWGDHQIIYLQKLLEIAHTHDPNLLRNRIKERRYSFANVPYRIAPFEDMWHDPHHTVRFDADLANDIESRVESTGTDGKLNWGPTGDILLGNLAEKLLIPALAKLSNFIPGAGIWMNTQRPEWNDANNALVGFGVSVVTLCYLRRYMVFLNDLFATEPSQDIEISTEVSILLTAIGDTFINYAPLLDTKLNGEDRKRILDELGGAGSLYREGIYEHGLTGDVSNMSVEDLCSFCDIAIRWIEHSIRENLRPDGLYHAYNLISTHSTTSVNISHLDEMLEGQVAVLSSGLLSASESLKLLQSLRNSNLYREDQHSYLLYPDRDLPRFHDKNLIPPNRINGSALVAKLISNEDSSLLVRDLEGAYHFSGSMRNADDVERVLQELTITGYEAEVKNERNYILSMFEEQFDHASFTGRSGAFFGYEGLGCIYWHMVSKLLLAVCETYLRAEKEENHTLDVEQIAERYFDIRNGLSQYKTPDEYGAFPIDPYSHTPGNQGAQQPGMTGQVKEDILCRWAELGIVVRDGAISFRPALLNESEFLDAEKDFKYYSVGNDERSISLPRHSLAFTYCQLPIIYHKSDDPHILLTYSDESTEQLNSCDLGKEMSAHVFSRSDHIQRIDAFVTAPY